MQGFWASYFLIFVSSNRRIINCQLTGQMWKERTNLWAEVLARGQREIQQKNSTRTVLFSCRDSKSVSLLSISHSFGRTPLVAWSARRRDLNLTTHTTLTTDKHPCPGGIRTHNLSRRVTVDPRLRPHGHWDRQTPQLLGVPTAQSGKISDIC